MGKEQKKLSFFYSTFFVSSELFCNFAACKYLMTRTMKRMLTSVLLFNAHYYAHSVSFWVEYKNTDILVNLDAIKLASTIFKFEVRA